MKPSRVPHVNVGALGRMLTPASVAAALSAAPGESPSVAATMVAIAAAHEELKAQYRPSKPYLLVIDDPVLPDGQSRQAALLEQELAQNRRAFSDIINNAFGNQGAADTGVQPPVPHNRSPRPLRRLKHALAVMALENSSKKI